MTEHDDPLPALRAEMDQVLAMAPDAARFARGLYETFVDEGFSEKQALYLTACRVLGTPGPTP